MKKQKGITLIALIITIIVMLILVGVSVSVALNTALFKTAQGVAKNTQIAKDEETELANGTINIGGETINIDDYISKLSLIPSNLKVGDIIEYTPASNYTPGSPYILTGNDGETNYTGTFYTEDLGEWKVLSIDYVTGKIKILPQKVTTGKVNTGWSWYADKNLRNLSNDTCAKLYGNTLNTDKYTATAESITIEEINRISEIEKFSEWIGANDAYITSTWFDDGVPGTAGLYGINESGEQVGVIFVYQYDGFAVPTGRELYSLRPIVTIIPKVQLTFVNTKGQGESSINYWKFE